MVPKLPGFGANSCHGLVCVSRCTVASHKKFLQRKQQVDELFAFGIVSN